LKDYLEVQSFTDLGCGDCNVLEPILGVIDCYVGIDIVDEVVVRNKILFPQKQFLSLDAIFDPLPNLDIKTGRKTRESRRSYVDLDAAPFRFNLLCIASHDTFFLGGELLQTKLYKVKK
jgi:hypothetical protein